jgi:hypothetical protein
MKKTILFLLLLFPVLCTLSPVVYAADTSGTTTATFLRIEQGVRALGMGGAFTAVSKDIESVWWNPAGASTIDATEVNASYSQYIADLYGSYAAIAIPRHLGCIIGSVNYVSMGSLNALDSQGNFIKSINLSAYAVALGYAFPLTSNMSFGFTVKDIQQNLGDDTSSGFGADAGCQAYLSDSLSLGVSVQNIGSGLQTDSYTNSIPLELRGGLAYSVTPKFLLALDEEKPSDSDTSTRLGAELKITDAFCLRAGYNSNSAAGFSCGAGINAPFSAKSGDAWWKDSGEKDYNHNVVSINYAYVTSQYFDAMHRVSVTVKF